MGKFRFNLALIFFILLLPSVSSEIEIDLEASEIDYGAPGNAFIDAGTNVTLIKTQKKKLEKQQFLYFLH